MTYNPQLPKRLYRNELNIISIYLLLSDAKISKDHIEQVLDVDAPQQSTERDRRPPQFLGDQFLPQLPRLNAAMQQISRGAQ